jgi:hypothetical protein
VLEIGEACGREVQVPPGLSLRDETLVDTVDEEIGQATPEEPHALFGCRHAAATLLGGLGRQVKRGARQLFDNSK